jgi:hypothetical protein
MLTSRLVFAGGGLDIFKFVPPKESKVGDFNHEFSSPEEEAAFYAEMAKEGVNSVNYKCNRAVIFISDQYHTSQPFEFKEGYENQRVNLTLLFGDRLGDRAAKQAAEQEQAKVADDLFGDDDGDSDGDY